MDRGDEKKLARMLKVASIGIERALKSEAWVDHLEETLVEIERLAGEE